MHLIERKPVKNMGEVKATQAETNKKKKHSQRAEKPKIRSRIF